MSYNTKRKRKKNVYLFIRNAYIIKLKFSQYAKSELHKWKKVNKMNKFFLFEQINRRSRTQKLNKKLKASVFSRKKANYPAMYSRNLITNHLVHVRGKST